MLQVQSQLLRSYHPAPNCSVRQRGIDLSLQRGVDVVERLVSHALHERLQPRALRLALSQAPVEIGVSIAVNAILGRPIFLAFVGVVEPGRR
jgi:hypothetical protein